MARLRLCVGVFPFSASRGESAPALTTTRTPSPSGWPAAEPREEPSTTKSATKRPDSRVHVNDLHATILHLTAAGHLQLTYRLNGRAFRLTDVAGRVVKEVVG